MKPHLGGYMDSYEVLQMPPGDWIVEVSRRGDVFLESNLRRHDKDGNENPKWMQLPDALSLATECLHQGEKSRQEKIAMGDVMAQHDTLVYRVRNRKTGQIVVAS